MDDKGFHWVEESNGQEFFPMVRRRKLRSKKMDFVGWGSEPLIEFLQSIGKDTSKQISQRDVTDIINQYVRENNLLNPVKKKRIICDQRLHALFGRKTVGRIKIHDLLEAHFAENHDESDDELSYSSEEEDAVMAYKKQNLSISGGKTPHQKKEALETPKSCFAAINSENMKLVYLKRTLVEDLLNEPESFEHKVVGSYVRIKADPNDYTQKNSHLLVQVVGVKKDVGTETLLRLSNVFKDARIYMLSDVDFSEEELEDLRLRVKTGLIKRPTVVDFEEKACLLHKDITKHWIPREIALLINRIAQANEKGWIGEKIEYLKRKKLLESPSEQERLLCEVPKVVAEELEPVAASKDPAEALKQNNSPKSILGEVSDVSTSDLDVQTCAPQNICSIVDAEQPAAFLPQQKGVAITTENRREILLEMSRENRDSPRMPVAQVKKTELIELSDDEPESGDRSGGNLAVDESLESLEWYYVDPQGEKQGPFSLTSLKWWSDANYFDSSFKIWKIGQSQAEAVLLHHILGQMFPH